MSSRFVTLPLHQIKTNPHNARTHSTRQIRQIANSIREFGFAAPLLIDEGHTLLAGHGRLQAAQFLGLDAVPVMMLEGLTEAKKRALLLADNRIALNAGWDRELLAVELTALPELLIDDDIHIDITGFEAAEIDALHEDFSESSHDCSDGPEKALVGPSVSRTGDLWQLGRHRLICGDCRDTKSIERLMSGAMADMVFTDPPYNVSMRDIGGRGAIRRQEFAMAFGEMTDPEFVEFLRVNRVSVQGGCKSQETEFCPRETPGRKGPNAALDVRQRQKFRRSLEGSPPNRRPFAETGKPRVEPE